MVLPTSGWGEGSTCWEGEPLELCAYTPTPPSPEGSFLSQAH